MDTASTTFDDNFDLVISEIASTAAALGQIVDSVIAASETIVNAMNVSDATLHFQDLIDSLPFLEEPNEVGFICINEATDTWMVRTLYEARRREWVRMVRQAQRMPAKHIRRNEKYRRRKNR